MAVGGTSGGSGEGCVDEGESLPGKLEPTTEPALILTSSQKKHRVFHGRLEAFFFGFFFCLFMYQRGSWPSGRLMQC